MEEIYNLILQFKFRNPVWVLAIPLMLMAIDVITGVVKAWARKEFKSSIMRAGLAKKVGEIMILIVGEVISYGILLPDITMNGISLYIIFMETVSILENANALGIPIPKFVKNAIDSANDQLQIPNNEENEN